MLTAALPSARQSTSETQTPDEVTDEVARSASDLWASFVSSLPRVGVAVVIVLVGWLVARGVRLLLRRYFERRNTQSFAQVMSKLVSWSIVFATALIAITVTFPSVKPVDLLAGLGFFSVAVGFAFQDILENTLSGVLLLFRQPFRSGDQIEVQDRTGTVEAITIRETRIKTFDGQLIVIPNRDVYKSVIRVQTHYDDRRLSFLVGIAYENDAQDACDVIVEALTAVPGVADHPPPDAIATELGVSTVNIEARFWCRPRQHDALLVLDHAIKAVKSALDAQGIEMPADIIALQATPSLQAALHDRSEVTPAGAVRSASTAKNRSAER